MENRPVADEATVLVAAVVVFDIMSLAADIIAERDNVLVGELGALGDGFLRPVCPVDGMFSPSPDRFCCCCCGSIVCCDVDDDGSGALSVVFRTSVEEKRLLIELSHIFLLLLLSSSSLRF